MPEHELEEPEMEAEEDFGDSDEDEEPDMDDLADIEAGLEGEE